MPTIFLIEDNEADVELFRMALEEASIECDLVLFEDGRQIIERILKVGSGAPDLIILDLNLPKSDGLEVLEVIRGAPGFATVPIAVFSSSSSVRERNKLARFQIREFIVKPADIDEYLSIGKVVRNLLEEACPQAAIPSALG